MSALGIIGVIAFCPVVPKVIRRAVPPEREIRLSAPAIILATLIQTSLIVIACAALGARIGPSLGLRSLLFGAGAEPAGLARSLTWAIVAGVIAGSVGGAIAVPFAKPLVAYLREIPMIARLLYGGFTEEVIIRWGFMTGIVWLLTKAFPGAPPPAYLLWLGILLTNVIFATGHIPIMRALKTSNVAVAATMIFVVSLPWGWLFWTFGIESAIAAHMAFHIVVEASSRRG